MGDSTDLVESAPALVTRPSPPKPRLILLAEDVGDLREFLVAYLNRKGHEVYAASDGAEAISMVQELRPDIALLNNLMPRMSGIAACRLISATPRLAGLPVVIYSACTLEAFRPPSLEAGACACWHTPMELAEFERRTLAVLAGRGLDPGRRRRK